MAGGPEAFFAINMDDGTYKKIHHIFKKKIISTEFRLTINACLNALYHGWLII